MDSKNEIKFRFRYSRALATGAFVWCYILIKIFFIDIERDLLFTTNFSNNWILNFRFLLYTIFLGIIWVITGHKRFFLNLLVILFFPFLVLFWHFPKLFFYIIPKKIIYRKSWLLFYIYINSWINFFYSLQINLIKVPALILSILVIIKSNNIIALYLAITVFIVILINHIIQRFRIAFSPIRLFRVNLSILEAQQNNKPKFLNPDIDKFQEMKNSNGQDLIALEEKKASLVDQILLTHSLLHFFGNRLREFKSPRVYMGFSALAVIYSILLSITLLTFANYGLYKINENEFLTSGNPNFFDFMFYTFNSFFFNSVNDFYPSGTLSKSINMLAPFTGVLYTLFILTIYFSVKSNEYQSNIEKIIKYSKFEVARLEQKLLDVFNLSVNEGFEVLKSLQISFARWINKLNQIN